MKFWVMQKRNLLMTVSVMPVSIKMVAVVVLMDSAMSLVTFLAIFSVVVADVVAVGLLAGQICAMTFS
jgi:hypothetical protein